MSRAKRLWVPMAILVGLGLGGCLPIELSVSSDGKILIPRQEGFYALDPAKGTVAALYVPKSDKPVFAVYAPDGKGFLAISQTAGGGMGSGFAVEMVPAAGQKAKRLLSASNLTYARWSPDGKKVTLTRMGDGKVAPMDENMPELILLDAAAGSRKDLASNVSTIHRWFPDSKHVLTFQIAAKDKDTSQYSGKLVKVDVATGKVQPLALVLGEKKVFFDLSPDGSKALFTAIKAGKLGEKIPASSKDDPQLFELNVADGTVRAVAKDVAFAIYSPKGTKVLVGSKSDSDGAIKLGVGDAALRKTVTVAEDAAKSVGTADTRDIYPGWIDDNTVHYLALRAVYGTEGKNLQLRCVGADGKNGKNLQTAVDAGVKE